MDAGNRGNISGNNCDYICLLVTTKPTGKSLKSTVFKCRFLISRLEVRFLPRSPSFSIRFGHREIQVTISIVRRNDFRLRCTIQVSGKCRAVRRLRSFRIPTWQPPGWGPVRVPEADRGSGSGTFRHFLLRYASFLFSSSIGGPLFSVRTSRSIPLASRMRGRCLTLKRTSSPVIIAPVLIPENGRSSPPPVLHCFPIPDLRGGSLQFQSFDQAYLERLRAGDYRAQEHFGAYFGALIQIKLRSRLRSREAIEDVRQETFSRFFVALRDGKILQPERLGSFVNSICNNVLLEHYRAGSRLDSLDDDDKPRELPDQGSDLLSLLAAKETEKKVREILEQLSERDRRLLREVFLEERDKDEVCRDFGVDRDYLRVLLHRAKQSFKSLYLKDMGGDKPEFTST